MRVTVFRLLFVAWCLVFGPPDAFPPRKSRRGFTLVELLVVMAIIGVLVGVTVPAVQKIRESAARTECTNNLRQIGIALHAANDLYGHMPSYAELGYPSAGVFSPLDRASFEGTIHFYLLPLLEQGNMMRLWDGTSGSNNLNGPGIPPTPRVYVCPSDPSLTADLTTNSGSALIVKDTGFAITSYSFNGQVFGDQTVTDQNWLPPPRLQGTFQDGTSNTALVFERYAICGVDGEVRTWGDAAGTSGHSEVVYITLQGAGNPPGSVKWLKNNVTSTFQVQPPPANCTFSSKDTSTAHAAMCVLLGDASTRTVSPAISLETWQALITPASGDLLGSDW